MGEPLRARILTLVGGLDPARLAHLLRRSVGGSRLALCFHRAGAVRREGELLPKLTSPAAEIDALIEFLLRAAGRTDPWLTVAFDDGYREAAEYVLDRAPLFPRVEWLFFVCPQKTERGVGFRWDLAEVRRRADASFDADAELEAPVDLSAENLRDDLREVASLPFGEIARMTGVPENTVKSRMRYALEGLRKRLGEMGVDGEMTEGRTVA